MKKLQKGFTLIELLVVIAIIGILASVVLVSLSSAKAKSQKAAFQAEVSGAIPSLISDCDSNATMTAMTDSARTDWGTISASSCGASGAGTFTTSASALPATLGCSAAITEAGAVYTGC